MCNMRGIIDPITSGFLASLIGSTTTCLVANAESQQKTSSITGTGPGAVAVFAENEVPRGKLQ